MRRTVKQSVVAALAAITATAGVLALPATAVSASTSPAPRGTLGQLLGAEACVQDVTGIATQEGCGAARALKSAGSTAMTPDGAFVYVAGTTDGGSIDVFSRDRVTGALTQVAGLAGCATATGANGCTSIPELSGLLSITLDHAGSKLYAAVPGASKVLILSVAPNGALSRPSSPSGCVQNSPTPTQTCSPGSGIPRPAAVALADDDSTLYVASYSNGSGSSSGSVAAFDLNTGSPVFRSCIQSGTASSSCQSAKGLDNAVGLAASSTSSGADVYVAAFGQSSTGALTYLTDSGGPGPAGLSFKKCFGNLDSTCTPARAVGGASDVVISPDGKNVYVGQVDLSPSDGSIVGGGVALFTRATDGTLNQPGDASGCVVETTVVYSTACTTGRGLKGTGSLVVSPDNANVYTAAALNNPSATNTGSTGSSAVAVFDRNPSPSDTATVGILTQPAGSLGCVSSQAVDSCAVVRGLRSPGKAPHSLVLSPTGSFLYASAEAGQSVAAFGRQGSDLGLAAVAQPGPYTVGQAYTLTLTVTNGGPQIAHNVTVTDAITAGAAILSATPSQGSCATNPTVCNLGTIPVNGSATVVVRFQPTASGTQTNTARVGADEGDADPSDNRTTTSLASGPTTLAIVSGAGQTTQTGTPFGQPLKASLKDNAGAPLVGVQVTFTAPSSGASAFFGSATTETVITDGSGVATSSTPRANNTAGTYAVTVSSAGAVSKTASLTNTLSSPSPSITPTASVSPTGSTRSRLTLLLTSNATITPGTPSTWRGFGRAGDGVTLRCYSRFPENSQPGMGTPAYFDARNDVLNSSGTVSFSLNPGTNTRCFLRYANAADSDATSSDSVVQNVATALSLSAYRDGVRQYHFQGTILPHRTGQLITLYRLDSNGNEIRTATTYTDASGVWRINRHFTGSGQFSFRARTSQTLTNAAGVSNTRLTVIH